MRDLRLLGCKPDSVLQDLKSILNTIYHFQTFLLSLMPPNTVVCLTHSAYYNVMDCCLRMCSGGSRKKYLGGGLAPHHLGGNQG